MITVKVNNTTHQIPCNHSLEILLKRLAISVDGIAVAINENIISKTDWINTTLLDGDNILIIKATQGG
ncbi:MAG: sulfur carrier protein ThiS [Oceanihabitans sp.]|nr:sulfur carrier protein ThiS [Oceanihabitans sp.]